MKDTNFNAILGQYIKFIMSYNHQLEFEAIPKELNIETIEITR